MGCALYNPRPADGDIVLPLPCDGGIVFRKVIVPVGGPLADLPIQVGQEGGAYFRGKEPPGVHRRRIH